MGVRAGQIENRISVQGVVNLDPARSRIQRIGVLVITIGPFLGLVAAIVSLWGHGVSGLDLGLLGTMYVLSGLGITIGYHRLLTHRGFTAPTWLRVLFASLGSLAVEGSVIGWVADHRRHHAFADKEGDPHSPHLEAREGIVGQLKGLWHAHLGWLFSEEKTEIQRWAPDMLKDRAMVIVNRMFVPLVVLSFTLPGVLGGLITGTWAGAVSGLIWGSLVRVFMLHHVTWSVNSICHFFGRRPFDTTDLSTNNWPLALISFGESWHNNHHAFPSSAVHGVERGQIDLSGALVVALEKLGVVRDVKRPTPKQLSDKRL